jgi:hypothetical protein
VFAHRYGAGSSPFSRRKNQESARIEGPAGRLITLWIFFLLALGLIGQPHKFAAGKKAS